MLCWAAWAVGAPRDRGAPARSASRRSAAVAPCFLTLAMVIAVIAEVDTATAAAAVVATLVAQVLVSRPRWRSGRERNELRRRVALPAASAAGAVPRTAAVGPTPARRRRRHRTAAARRRAVGVRHPRRGDRGPDRPTSRPGHCTACRRRFAVLVPAGFVSSIRSRCRTPSCSPASASWRCAPLGALVPPGDDVLDLRLGASLGGVSLALDCPAEMFRSVRLAGGPSRCAPPGCASPSSGSAGPARPGVRATDPALTWSSARTGHRARPACEAAAHELVADVERDDLARCHPGDGLDERAPRHHRAHRGSGSRGPASARRASARGPGAHA